VNVHQLTVIKERVFLIERPLKEGAFGIFARFMTMREKQILIFDAQNVRTVGIGGTISNRG